MQINKLTEQDIIDFWKCDHNNLHEYVEGEVIHNCTVQTLICKKCGSVSIGWTREGDKN